MQTFTLATLKSLNIDENSVVGYRYDNVEKKTSSVSKLQKNNDTWEFRNLTHPEGYVGKNNTRGWPVNDFTSPMAATRSLATKFPKLTMILFDDINEFNKWKQ